MYQTNYCNRFYFAVTLFQTPIFHKGISGQRKLYVIYVQKKEARVPRGISVSPNSSETRGKHRYLIPGGGVTFIFLTGEINLVQGTSFWEGLCIFLSTFTLKLVYNATFSTFHAFLGEIALLFIINLEQPNSIKSNSVPHLDLSMSLIPSI